MKRRQSTRSDHLYSIVCVYLLCYFFIWYNLIIFFNELIIIILQHPETGKRERKSLGTTDGKLAEMLAEKYWNDVLDDYDRGILVQDKSLAKIYPTKSFRKSWNTMIKQCSFYKECDDYAPYRIRHYITQVLMQKVQFILPV